VRLGRNIYVLILHSSRLSGIALLSPMIIILFCSCGVLTANRTLNYVHKQDRHRDLIFMKGSRDEVSKRFMQGHEDVMGEVRDSRGSATEQTSEHL
jgi:hypothetical protein